jgi:hypothetical protein
MFWREPKARSSCCYFRFTNVTVITSKSKHTVKYPVLPFAIMPVPHREEFPILKPRKNLTLSDNISDSDEDHGEQEGENADCDPTFKVVPFIKRS